MEYINQKKLAKKIFKKLGLNVDLNGCFDKIIPQLTLGQCLQVLNLIKDEKIKSLWAFNVAFYKPEHKKEVIDFVTDEEWAYNWAYTIGDRDIMADKIKSSRYAFFWALNIGNRDIMIDKITDSKFAYFWIKKIGDRDIMIKKVTDYIYINRLKFLQHT